VTPDDFVVEEILGFEARGAGSHWLLRVEKRGANTEWVARDLARFAGCRPFDVGFAGLKDRHAVAIQHFTAPSGRRTEAEWRALEHADYRVLAATPHERKLPRGALRGNRFTITLREVTAPRATVDARLRSIAASGVPNYFGPQRFGRDANNLCAGVQGVLPVARDARAFALSALRSLLFNAVLAERVTDGSWCALQPGDVANLDGTGSVFRVSEVDPELASRVGRLDVHPTGPLWGDGATLAAEAVAAREAAVAERFPSVVAVLARERLRPERRALRVAAHDLAHEWLDESTLRVAFRLGAGAYATTVLAEVLELVESTPATALE
jgi:tRNA pseudouridine13 synthase